MATFAGKCPKCCCAGSSSCWCPLYNSAVANISLKLPLLVVTFPLMAFIGRTNPGTFFQAKQVQNSPFQPTKGRSGETLGQRLTLLTTTRLRDVPKAFRLSLCFSQKKSFKGSTKQTRRECLRRDLSASPLGPCLEAEPRVHYGLFVTLERCAPNGYKDVLTSEVRLTGLQLTVTPITDLIALPGTL